VERERPEVWDILEDIISDHPVFLNRAPTLHRLGIQSFYPVLVEGKAIKLHPFVCAAFNADFDGDQMAVHIPLSFESQLENRILMLSSYNLLHPASGHPIAVPSQDIVLGCYYLTKLRLGQLGEGKIFADTNEVILAYSLDKIQLHAKIKVEIEGKVVNTTPGRIIFNTIIPRELKEIGFYNEVLNKGKITEIIGSIFKKLNTQKLCKFLDDIKELGCDYAALSGVTVSIDDILVPQEKGKIIKEASHEVNQVENRYNRGIITDAERYNRIIDIWSHTTNDVADVMFKKMSEDREGFNPIFMMADSGARGSKDQIKQLAGMRGLMAKPQKRITGQRGEIIENPIIANFKEGLSVLEYFISTHGARKGLADTALKTADAGYLTRRLVDVAQDLVISEVDCGTVMGVKKTELKEGEDVIESLPKRIVGRFAQEDIFDPLTDKLICSQNQMIDEDTADKIEKSGIPAVLIRSVLTCESRYGICVKCYGRNLANLRIANIGDAVGIMAAQSIGEPGTQLTLRTFHIGGTASRITAQSKTVSKIKGVIKFVDINKWAKKGRSLVALNRNGQILIEDEKQRILARYEVPYGAYLSVQDGEKINPGALIMEWDPYNLVICTEKSGKIKFQDIKERETLKLVEDETKGTENRVIIEHREKTLNPHIIILDDQKNKIGNYAIPAGAILMVEDEQAVEAGDILAKIPREISKTRDITGGLPRVAELFEARRPHDPAIISEIDGIVHFGDIERGQRKIIIRDENNEERGYMIPHGRHLRVHEGDRVKAGERLIEGPVDPHDILRIKGENAVQEYLVNEIQEVYRLQGVKINDKHIECIVRQMLRKIRIIDEGDTSFLEGESISKVQLRIENARILEEGGRPASYESLLLGITKASLGTDSFVSAASFQETTKVLSEAAISDRVDYLMGLKENVILGNLIPCGSGSYAYNNIKIKDLEAEIPMVAETVEESGILEKTKESEIQGMVF
ncbi:MAG: DNA-directed RNA polymerase subunit beta', partial [Elusimicrobiota bacterium]